MQDLKWPIWYIYLHKRELVASDVYLADKEYTLVDIIRKDMTKEEALALAKERRELHVYD